MEIPDNSGQISFGVTKAGLHTVVVQEWGNDAWLTYRQNFRRAGACPGSVVPKIVVTLTGCTACRPGRTFIGRVSLSNPPPRTRQLKLGFVMPAGTPVNRGDPHLELPVNFSFDGELVRGTITVGHAQGNWQFCGRLLETSVRAAPCGAVRGLWHRPLAAPERKLERRSDCPATGSAEPRWRRRS